MSGEWRADCSALFVSQRAQYRQLQLSLANEIRLSCSNVWTCLLGVHRKSLGLIRPALGKSRIHQHTAPRQHSHEDGRDVTAYAGKESSTASFLSADVAKIVGLLLQGHPKKDPQFMETAIWLVSSAPSRKHAAVVRASLRHAEKEFPCLSAAPSFWCTADSRRCGV